MLSRDREGAVGTKQNLKLVAERYLAASNHLMRIFATLWILASTLAFGQRPPVILIDGYHLLCQSENISSDHDFGALQPRLEAEGIRVYFFGTCSFPGKPSIEALGDSLGGVIRNLNVPEVDLV